MGWSVSSNLPRRSKAWSNGSYRISRIKRDFDAIRKLFEEIDGLPDDLPADASRRPAIVDCNWHRVDVVRDVDAGTIKVYVDLDRGPKDQSPLFEVVDRTYDWGFVALASFDDHASFGRLGIEGEARPAQIPSHATGLNGEQ